MVSLMMVNAKKLHRSRFTLNFFLVLVDIHRLMSTTLVVGIKP